MHPGGRPYPHSTHVLKQSAQFAQRVRVRTVRERALDPVHRSHSLVAREEEHARSSDEDQPQRENRGASLTLPGMVMVRPTELVTLCHARRSATTRSVPTAASTTSSVYMSAVCMRASSVPRCSLRARSQASRVA
eukprot:2084131-Pleurochrysis_carterae.AAC.2